MTIYLISTKNSKSEKQRKGKSKTEYKRKWQNKDYIIIIVTAVGKRTLKENLEMMRKAIPCKNKETGIHSKIRQYWIWNKKH